MQVSVIIVLCALASATATAIIPPPARYKCHAANPFISLRHQATPGLSNAPELSSYPGPSTIPSAGLGPNPAPQHSCCMTGGFQARLEKERRRAHIQLHQEYEKYAYISPGMWDEGRAAGALTHMAQLMRVMLDVMWLVMAVVGSRQEPEIMYEVPRLWTFLHHHIQNALNTAVVQLPSNHTTRHTLTASHDVLAQDGEETCSICCERCPAAVLTQCGHVFCITCIIQMKKFPYCGNVI